MSQSFSFSPQQFFATRKGLLNLSSAEWETLEILFDVDQCQMLLASLEEARLGQVVSFAEAFGDLDR
jgi:hypothetical protein